MRDEKDRYSPVLPMGTTRKPMVEKTIIAILINGGLLFVFLLYYFSFCGMMINVKGKNINRARKKYRGFWTKFLCLDFKQKIVTWHYVLFIVFLIASLILLILLNLAAFADGFILQKELWVILVCTFFCPYLIVAMNTYNKR